MDSAALPAGHRVFEYRIDKMLGGGGFGLTYLAHDINLQLPVALKEYFPGDLAMRSANYSVHVRAAEGDAQFTWGLERFLDEARALASFRHPNIARVLRYFKENGTAYIVMEYETGDPLKRWLARQLELSQKTLLNVVYPLMDGLEAVHKMNFLHRDIKPDNIYIRADGSPVLLDFGAARRVTADRDMTNIISPGFAPFEQYHSQGNQGPWTDIYSLGAVMYWMTTGHKPVESASRVKHDPMPSAVQTGHPSFGQALLKAIDWAMSPDETRRPQSVAEFRAALTDSEDAKTRTLPQPRTHRLNEEARPNAGNMGNTGNAGPTNYALPTFAPNSQSVPHSPSDALRKNVLGTIMFVDLVAYSTYSNDQQVAAKTRFNELINMALKGVAEPSRIVIDTGDGAAICFLGDPEEALQSGLLLRGLMLQKYSQTMSVRIGLHLGSIRIVSDINNRVNVVGDGINVAQRVMDFAKVNQIVVSRSYYEVVSRITDSAASLFSAMGTHMDKHMRAHDIYAVLDTHSQPAAAPPAALHSADRSVPFSYLASLTPEMVSDIETELARLIGPLARVLVKKALPRAATAQGLRDLLSVSIPDATAREAFVKVKSSTSTSRANSHSFSRRSAWPISQNSQTTPTGPTGPLAQPSQPSQFSQLNQPGQPSQARGDISQNSQTSRPASPGQERSWPASTKTTTVPVQNLNPDQLAQLEKVLSQYIGPMARMIVKKESAKHFSLAALLPVLAVHIDRVEDRARFVAAVQKLQLGLRN